MGVLVFGLLLGSASLAWAQDDTNDARSDAEREAQASDAEAREQLEEQQATGEVDEPDDLDDIENLVVTARRRPEFLQQTPVALLRRITGTGGPTTSAARSIPAPAGSSSSRSGG